VDQSFSLSEAVELYNSGRFPDSERVCMGLIAVNPSESAVFNLLGVMAARAGRIDHAVRCLGRAARADPIQAQNHTNLGALLQSVNRPDRKSVV